MILFEIRCFTLVYLYTCAIFYKTLFFKVGQADIVFFNESEYSFNRIFHLPYQRNACIVYVLRQLLLLVSTVATGTGQKEKSKCYIATSVYGSLIVRYHYIRVNVILKQKSFILQRTSINILNSDDIRICG